MAYDHNLPSVLNPTGDYCVPLFIPHHPDYTALLLGVISTLEDLERYERDPNFDNEDAKIVVAQWRDRTITPLIEAIASATACGGAMKATVHEDQLGADRTTTSSTYVAITGSDFSHTFTKPNALIRCANMLLINSGMGFLVEPRVDGVAGDSIAHAFQVSATARTFVCAATFENITTGVAKTIALYWKIVSNGTNTIFNVQQLVWEIIEYD